MPGGSYSQVYIYIYINTPHTHTHTHTHRVTSKAPGSGVEGLLKLSFEPRPEVRSMTNINRTSRGKTRLILPISQCVFPYVKHTCNTNSAESSKKTALTGN
jgi:hypothetical protein